MCVSFSIKRRHLAFVFVVGNDMTPLNNKKENNNNNNNNRHHHHLIAASATISILAIAIIVVASSTTSMVTTTPVAATLTTAASNTNATTTPSSSSSSGIELSPQPIYQVRSPEPNITPINQTHATLTFSGNGTLTLPNTTETINTTSNGTAIISFTTSSGYGKETIRTEDGETATATLYEIIQFNSPAPSSGGKGIITKVFQTNSTGMLAPLNGMIAVGIDDLTSSGESHITFWRWESGIPLSPTTMEESPPSPMNATTATEEEQQQQQQQTTTTIPAPLLE
jgi:hypothetical protein